jgi:hypothetical protein
MPEFEWRGLNGCNTKLGFSLLIPNEWEIDCFRKILNSHLFLVKFTPCPPQSGPGYATPDVQVQEPLVVVKKRGRV